MATYHEVKQLLCRMLGKRSIGEDDDIVFEINFYKLQKRETKQIVFSNSKLLEIYNKVNKMEKTGLVLFSAQNYEIAIKTNYSIQNFSVTFDDRVNSINYDFGYPSIEYCVFLLILIKDEIIRKQCDDNIGYRLRRTYWSEFYEKNDYSIETILPRIMGIYSLKIINSSELLKSIDDFRTMKTSFLFNFMYKSGNYFVEYHDIFGKFILNDFTYNSDDDIKIDMPPLRKYTEDVVDYYKQALASNDPFIKYISFYHVVEYFFDEVFKRTLVKDLRNKITHPDFSYKNDEKLFEIAGFIKNRLRMNNETGQGNELQSLIYVLTEYVNIDELKNRITLINPECVEYYKKNKVNFCKATMIDWSNSADIYKLIAKRIYTTRNALVHSKSGKNKERYRPYDNEKELQFEIPLVQAIAETIIINSSEII